MPIRLMQYWLPHPHQSRLQSQCEIVSCKPVLKFQLLVQCLLAVVADVKTSMFALILEEIERLDFDTSGLRADDQRVFPELKAVVFL